MVGDECIHPLWAKHSDWCGLAGVIQAIVETLPNSCALMFPPALAPAASFSSSFKPASFEDDDNDDLFGPGPGLYRFDSGKPAPSGSGCDGFGCSPSLSSTPLPYEGHFVLASDQKEVPSNSLGTHPADSGEHRLQPLDKDLDLGLEADNGGNGEKNQPSDDSVIDPRELKILRGIINMGPNNQQSIMPQSGDKWGSAHLDGSGSSDSSGEDLDTKGVRNRKKGVMPTKMASNPSQWTEEDINIVHQIWYKTDLDWFQMYWRNKMAPADPSMINTKDHSAYIKVAKADPSTIIKKSIFSMAAYCKVLRLKGGNTSKFNKEVGAKFKKLAKGSWAPDAAKVAIDWMPA